MDFVGLSFYDAGAESVKDLIARGRKRIAYVRPLPVTVSGRYAAYLDVMREAGLEIEDIITSVADAGR